MAVQPGLCGTWSETPKTGFLTTQLISSTQQIFSYMCYEISQSIMVSVSELFSPSLCLDDILLGLGS